VPGPNEEYLLYQTLVGAWPIDAARLRQAIVNVIQNAVQASPSEQRVDV